MASLDEGVEVIHGIGADRGVYLYVIEGAARLGEHDLDTGDAAKVTDQADLMMRAREPSELILVDVPMEFAPVGVWKTICSGRPDRVR